MTSMLNALLRRKALPSQLNRGLIKLVPKGDARFSPKDWQPILLLNVAYKVLAKILAEDKIILARTVHGRQFGFLPGRIIHEAIFNTLLVMDYAISQNKRFMLVNIDLEKAYDHIGWDFILATLAKCGFSTGFTSMIRAVIYKCLSLPFSK